MKYTKKEISIIANYESFCFSGDVIAGYNYLTSLSNPSSKIIKFIQKVEQRFICQPPKLHFKTKITWVRKVLQFYSEYYIAVMMKTLTIQAAEKILCQKLASEILQENYQDMDEIEEILSQKFTAIGWHFLGGITLPFRGPYIYEKLTKKKYQIRLPLGIRSINVFFMENFHSLSWLDFATFGNRGTGGWAKQEGLYCVLEKYDVKSVEFTNSYLKHEAQHFDDYTRFPHLLEGHQSTLEFRAKLAELIYSESTESFRYFMKEAKNDKNFPHLLASYNIKTEFSKKLSFSDETSLLEFEDLQVIKTTALEIYLEHTRKLEDQLVVHREKPVELVL